MRARRSPKAHKRHPIIDQIHERRRELGLTQKELAEKAGYETNTIQNLEYGINIRYQTLFDTIAALGLKLILTQ